MDTRNLLFKTLADLEIKSQSRDWYDMLLISGLIYKLLYDQHPLVDEISISGGKPIIFEVNNRSVPIDPNLMFWSIEDGIDPLTSAPHMTQVIRVDREGLYMRPVMVVHGKIITIKDLIRFLRNKQGSVHIDNISLDDKDKILKKLQSTVFIGGYNSGLRLMQAISRVVIRGLEPLKN